MKITSGLSAACILLVNQFAWSADRLVPSQYPTIQAAIDVAADGDVVQIAPGTYAGPIDFSGKAITVRGAADPTTVLISGGTWGNPIVRIATGESATSTLEGVTITGGYGYQNGGGILIESSSPTILNCRVIGNVSGVSDNSGNSLGGLGAGVHIKNGSPVISNCLIAANTAYSNGSRGAGVFVSGSSAARFKACTISGNQMTGGGSQVGAGIFIQGTSASYIPEFEDCVISGNNLAAGGDASAMYLGSTVSLTRCRVSQNGCSYVGGCGGVTVTTGVGVFLRDCTFCGTNSSISGPFVDMGGNRFPQVCDGCIGDLDSNGKIDGADLGILLSKWGPCSN
jgi:hypothetical protein